MEFIFYLLLRVKRERIENVENGDTLWQNLLKIIKDIITGSFVYQIKTSKLLL